jgi:hypothetical protein
VLRHSSEISTPCGGALGPSAMTSPVIVTGAESIVMVAVNEPWLSPPKPQEPYPLLLQKTAPSLKPRKSLPASRERITVNSLFLVSLILTSLADRKDVKSFCRQHFPSDTSRSL